jgi:hypothetical protein
MTDYTNKNDLIILKTRLEALTDTQKRHILSCCISQNLFSHPHWILTLISFVVTKNRIMRGYNGMYQKMPEELDNGWNFLLEHMVNGVDQYDKRSAGGWDFEETKLFLQIVKNYTK